MKHLKLSLSDDDYDRIVRTAQKKGKDIHDFVVDVLEDELDVGTSFVQKSGIHKSILGDSIVQNGNLVHLNGIYYNYRIQGEKTDGRIEQIDKDTVYKVVDFDGNVVVLRPTE